MATWISDDNGNRCSVEYWGDESSAKSALATLRLCSDCSDCSGCSRCSRCSGCSGCSRCSRCSRCSDCSRCSRCSDCSGCSGCSGCSEATNLAPAQWPQAEVPVITDIHRKVYEAASQPGALDMGSFHVCETAHCRAGWVIHLAGEAGYALERKTSTVFAAMQIYEASGYQIAPTRFFDSNEMALGDMKRLAEASV